MDLDPQWVMAISTVVLIGVTGFYAWRTSSIAGATKEMAEATRRSVDVANTTLVLQHAPIVVARSAGGSGSTAPDGRWRVSVSVQNIGAAPAFGVSVEVTIGSETFSAGPYPTLEPGQEPTRVDCGVRYGDFEAAGKTSAAELRYSDLLSRAYRVIRLSNGSIEISLEGQPLRLPASLRGSSAP